MSWWGEDNGQRIVTAVVESVSAGVAMVRVDAFDNGADTFGPMPAPSGLVAGDDVLVAFDQNDEPWIIGGRDGVSAAITALQPSTRRLVGAVGQPAWGASWGNFGGGFDDTGFYKAAGRVWLSGLAIRSGTPTLGETVWTFPAGFRPSARKLLSPYTGSVGRVDVYPDGRLTIITPLTSGVLLGFDGLSFEVA